jgi:hypothetical protein
MLINLSITEIGLFLKSVQLQSWGAKGSVSNELMSQFCWIWSTFDIGRRKQGAAESEVRSLVRVL